jgi:hypothetical protein
MSDETPKKPRQRSPYTRSVDTVLVRFTLQALPPETEFPGRERKGRPARSPSLPPVEPQPNENPPTEGAN